MTFWCDKYLYGKIKEFLLSLDIFAHVIKFEDLIYLFELGKMTKKELLDILEGILLFTFNEKRIVDLVFGISAYIKDKDFFFEYCRDNIYVNYAGKLIENAFIYAKSENEYQSDLAYRLVEYHEFYKKKIQLGYEDKDFIPPIERQRIYQELRFEQNRKINEQAEKNSVFANIIQSRKMKYGKRVAFVQINRNGEFCYNVSEYENHIVKRELPCDFINDPIKYKHLKEEYLRKRGKNETHS